VASGLLTDHTPFDEEVTWLVEPLRGGLVRHWSGTMEHPLPKDKGLLSATLYALGHFSLAYTQNDVVLADIQSK